MRGKSVLQSLQGSTTMKREKIKLNCEYIHWKRHVRNENVKALLVYFTGSELFTNHHTCIRQACCGRRNSNRKSHNRINGCCNQ
ncbi:CLUMA_CG020326, isoform A [Clunio marinus]|uniref:CLUMA_CG020326, isoform A n=1 Tax=Clunio marinus TaxID=568069 RepID=A0A1J1J4M3_9DIPT|nr:CLUMA_CG020326, isoform A [Clunio marinus]